jgi:hypothetical protein
MQPTDPAYSRYTALADALRGEDQLGGGGRAVVERLAAWTTEPDIRLLVRLIEARARADTDRYVTVLAQIGARLDRAERNEGGDYLITVSVWLARKLLDLITPE